MKKHALLATFPRLKEAFYTKRHLPEANSMITIHSQKRAMWIASIPVVIHLLNVLSDGFRQQVANAIPIFYLLADKRGTDMHQRNIVQHGNPFMVM